MQIFPASIKNYLVAIMVCLCVPGVGALGYMASQSIADVRTNIRLADLVEADRALLIAGNSIRANRGQAQTAIQAADNPAPIIEKVELANRKDLDEAVARLGATSLTDREALIAAVVSQQKATDAKFADLRAEAAKPKAERSLAATMPWYNGVGDIEGALVKAADATSLAVRMADPILADLQSFKSTGWRVRSSYGVQCSVLRPQIASGKALEPAQIRRIGELRGVADSGMSQLLQMAQRPGVSAELVSKIGVMNSEMQAANRTMDALGAKLGQNAGPLMPAEDWTRLCNGPFTAMVSAITQSLDDMASTTKAKLNRDWMQLAVIGGLLAALMAISIMSWRGVQRRIAKPVVALKSALDVMQAGDFSQPIPAPSSPDEIGALSGALETYRENALSVEASRRDRELAMLADSEQAAHVQKLLGEVSLIVSAAQNGDFSGRAAVGDVGGALGNLVAGINEINAVVDGATTEFAMTLQAVAAGDLTQRVDTAYRGRFAELQGAINDTVERLSSTVRTIQVTSADVGLAAREINMGADDLSKRTEEQASSL
ncbi:methyl-accepting chemotaxis protein, partial [Bosea sp. AAP35]|uniref:HAMP domain-containing protein n=1 Tax=Bosea sp. AAP35 TaxID=1523417 RepID=UPI0018D19B0D